MHELSIAYQLVRAADAAAREARAGKVHAVHLRLGALAGVVRESLEFCWELATEDTLLAGSRLEIEPVEVTAHCTTCARTVTPESAYVIRCPHCGTPTPEVRSGRELELRALDIDRVDPPRAAPSPEPGVPVSPARSTDFRPDR